MDTAALIQSLSSPSAYPEPVESIEVRQTHISAVFLTPAHAYKVKKPVRFGFLDFSTLDRRRHFCEEEVRLNRRLAPDVYLGVVPITLDGGKPRFAGAGEVMDWAVKMRRLPEQATFQERIRRNDIDISLVEAFARRLAAFHRAAPEKPVPPAFGRFDAVSRNLLDIFAQSEAQVGTTVSRPVFDRLRQLTEAALERWRPLIDARAARGMARDTHGDLHLDHVYYFPDRAPPGDLVIVDCIEFNERFRFIDPVADMAFAHMDFLFHGRRDLAGACATAYFQATGDEEGKALLPLYTAYRASVRGSVAGLKLAEKEVAAADRAAELPRARAHWLLALEQLEEPARRPCLLLVGGLPGTGKSTLARALADRAGLTLIRSDVVRKELAGLPPDVPSQPEKRAQLYSTEANDSTYAECLRRAEAALFQGERVLVDATFREESRRRPFLEAAQQWAVPALFLVARAAEETVRERLQQRRGDASDADWAIYQRMATTWEEPGEGAWLARQTISMAGKVEQAVDEARAVLRTHGLSD